MQTTLKHDSQGFLVGEPIDLSQAVADWAAIRDDVHAIRMAIAGIGRQLAQAPNNQTPHAGVASVVATFQSDVTTPGVRMPAVHVVVPPARVPSAANAPSATSPVGVAVPSRGRSEFSRPEVQSVVPPLVQPSAAYSAEHTRPSQAHRQITPAELAVIAPHVSAISPAAELGPNPTQFHATPTDKEVVQRSMERGSDGRFVKKSGEEPSVGIDGRTQQAMHDLAERVVGVVRESGASLTEVDPAAKALSEVTQPIARGYALLRGGGKEGKGQEGWLRRIYAALAGWPAPVVAPAGVAGLGAESPVNKAGAGKPVLAQTAEPVSPRAAPAELRSLAGGVLPALTGLVVRNVAAPGVTSPVGEAGASQPAQPTTAEPATSRAAPSELQPLTGGAPPAMPGDAAGASALTAPVVTHVAVPGAVSPVNKAGAGKPVLAQTAEPVSPRAAPAELRSLTGGVLPAMSREAAVASALPSIAAPSAASPVGDAGAGKPVQAKTAGPANTRAILSGLRLLASGVPPVIPGEAAVTPVQEALAVAHVAVPGAASPVNEAGAGQPVQAKTAELAIARAAASELQSLLANGVPPGIPGEAAVTTPVLEAPAVAHVAAPGAAPLTRDTSVGKPMQVRAAEPVSPRAAPAELRSLAGGVLPALPGEAAAAPTLTAPVVTGVAAPAEIQSLGGDVSPAAPRGVGATAAWPTPASPSVAAFGMMATPTDVAQPKGMALPRGEISPEAVGSPKSDKRRDGLLRSILATLTGLRKEETAFNKAASKSLKNIEDKPDGGGAPGGGGMLGDLLPLLMRLPVLGTLITGLMSLLTKAPMLGRLFGAGDSKAAGASAKPGLLGRILGKSASPSVGAAPGVVAEAGAVAKGATAKAGRVAGNLAKRLPILGALLAVGSGALESTAIEGDATATRDDKNARHGKNWGGIGGGLAGATLGASLGSVVPVVGTIVGGLVGAVVGEWLGSSAGEVIGKHFAGLTEAMLNGWSEVKVAALGTWDWVKASWDDQVSEIGGIFTKLREALEEKWSGFVASAETEWKTISGMFASAYEGLKSLPGIGSAIKAAEAGVRKIAEAAGSAKDGAIELGGRAVDAVKSGAGSAWEATKSAAGSAWSGATNFAAGLVPQGLKDKVAARRALETGANYRQGNIAGLDEAHTRALVASTAATESAGGKLDVINSAGYMGRYQAGAGWLAEAGLIKGGGAAVKAAMKADGFTNEYKWGQEGGMTRFLKNPDNWSGGMSYDKYLASADTQDAAFKINSDKSYQSLVRKGVITPKMSQDEVAGILKARHIAGEGGAARAARGEDGPADANGTTALKYKNDLAPGNAFTQAFTPGATTAAAATTTATKPVTAPAAPQNLSQKLPLGTTTPAGAAVRDIASSGGAMTLASAGTGSPLATPAMPVVAAVKMPAVPSMPTAPKITEAPPPMAVPLASNEGRKPLAVIAAPSDVGQNVRDRGIAHIATGGLGGAGA